MAYKFFQNKECEYFPCHKGLNPEEFSCLFCFCPLYPLADRCGGNFTYTQSGIKDCSNCLRPHKQENYEMICQQLPDVVALAAKGKTESENP